MFAPCRKSTFEVGATPTDATSVVFRQLRCQASIKRNRPSLWPRQAALTANLPRRVAEGALKAGFGSADFVGDLTVFNVGGSKYRLIAFVHYLQTDSQADAVEFERLSRAAQGNARGWKFNREELHDRR